MKPRTYPTTRQAVLAALARGVVEREGIALALEDAGYDVGGDGAWVGRLLTALTREGSVRVGLRQLRPGGPLVRCYYPGDGTPEGEPC